MSKSNNDDLADALARLAGGDVAPSEHVPPAPPVPPSAAPVPPDGSPRASARPAAPKPVAAVPPAAPPSPPRPVRPAAPSLSTTPPVPRPAPPPAAPPPVIRAVVPVARKARPVAPTLANSSQPRPAAAAADVDGEQSTGLSAESESSQVIDDDDMMSMPAPEASVFQPKTKNVAEMRAKAAARKNLELRRTFIPILLTCGLMLLVFASLKYVSGADSMLAVAVPVWVPPVLGVIAIVFLGLAVVNMLSVKQQLDAEKKQA